MRTFSLIRLEFYKVLRLKLTYLFLASTALVIVIWGISSAYFFPDKAQPGTGYNFLLTSNQTTMSFLGTMFVMIFCALLISAETASGTLQTNLTNPISRGEFLTAKFAAGWLFSLLLILSMALPAVIIGALKFGYGGYIEEGLVLFTRRQMFSNIIVCYFILAVIISAYVGYSLLVSVLISNPGLAIGTCVGTVLMMDFIRGKLGISSFLFQSYIEAPFDIARGMTEGFIPAWRTEASLGLGVSLAWTLACFAAAQMIFQNKDYKS